ncbi:MAG: phage tail protein [Roseburia sp.]|nr:phage tail protein [Roseburia sp.]
MTIEIEGLDDVSAALGDLKRKTPAVAKTAINATAREARKLMVASAKARYAVNTAGQRHLKELVQRKKATNTSLSAELHIASMRNDLGYFQSRPNKPFMGRDVARAPEHFTARVLKSSRMTQLTGKGNLSKGFLVEFKSGHVGMVQRVIGTGRFHYTARSGAPSNSDKMMTMGSPSAEAMHRKIWPEVRDEVEVYLLWRLKEQTQKVIDRAKRRRQ